MGMFDWVRFKQNCPNCGETLTSWQSKDEYCVMEPVKPHKVKNFYTSCGGCKAWVNFYKEHGDKTWTRTVSMDFLETKLPEFTEEFTKKYLKEHTTDV